MDAPGVACSRATHRPSSRPPAQVAQLRTALREPPHQRGVGHLDPVRFNVRSVGFKEQAQVLQHLWQASMTKFVGITRM